MLRIDEVGNVPEPERKLAGISDEDARKKIQCIWSSDAGANKEAIDTEDELSNLANYFIGNWNDLSDTIRKEIKDAYIKGAETLEKGPMVKEFLNWFEQGKILNQEIDKKVQETLEEKEKELQEEKEKIDKNL
ncbi:MAG: hypothetical protein E7Z89_03540 [Cyanobacteria bacterium SIG28]|nr:hypothetical protein [Cyanobacteria bacterium SIG28]